MRSKQLLNLYKALSELNCHYSHYLFISEQFIQDNKKLITNKSEHFVTSIYKANIYATQFNVMLKKLPKEIEDTKCFIIRSFYLLCFSNFEIYCRDIYNFIAQFKDIPELHSKSSPISQLFDNLLLVDLFAEEEINTLVYLRLRRNALIHRDSKKTARGELIQHIKANGKKLNKFWSGHKFKMSHLDFTNRNDLYNFTGDSAIEMINIIRLLAEKIDLLLLQSIEEKRLIQFIVEGFKNTYPNISEPSHLKRKFNHYAMIEYGATFNEGKLKSLLGE